MREKEIISQNKKKIEVAKNEYNNIQKVVLTELFKKLIMNIIPIELKIFCQKFLKLKEYDSNDSLEVIIDKINLNQEMYLYIEYSLQEIYDLNNNIKNKSNANNQTAQKLYNFFTFLKRYLLLTLVFQKILKQLL